MSTDLTDLDILKELIQESAKIPLGKTGYGKICVTLTEPQCPGYSVDIQNIPKDAIVIKSDAFKSPDGIFKGSKGECQRADYVIISDKYILYIELKQTNASEKEIIQQFHGTRCLISYCREIGLAFWNGKNFLTNQQSRFVSFGRISIGKKKTRITPQKGSHDKPERMLKVHHPRREEFNKLVGNP